MLLPMVTTAVLAYFQDLWDQPNAEEPIVQMLTEQAFWMARYGIIGALFAVVIHRSILLDERVSLSRWFFRLSKREITFTGWSFFIGGGMWLMFAIGIALSMAIAIPFASWCSNQFSRIGETQPWLENLGETIRLSRLHWHSDKIFSVIFFSFPQLVAGWKRETSSARVERGPSQAARSASTEVPPPSRPSHAPTSGDYVPTLISFTLPGWHGRAALDCAR